MTMKLSSRYWKFTMIKSSTFLESIKKNANESSVFQRQPNSLAMLKMYLSISVKLSRKLTLIERKNIKSNSDVT